MWLALAPNSSRASMPAWSNCHLGSVAHCTWIPPCICPVLWKAGFVSSTGMPFWSWWLTRRSCWEPIPPRRRHRWRKCCSWRRGWLRCGLAFEHWKSLLSTMSNVWVPVVQSALYTALHQKILLCGGILTERSRRGHKVAVFLEWAF